MQYQVALVPLAMAGAAIKKPTVYLIRHGEKPSDGNGLNVQGEQRAQCLRNVFGRHSDFRIDYVMAQTPKEDGRRSRPLQTVQPIANDLGLAVDTSCDRDDNKCVVKAIKNYRGNGNILICWEHHRLTNLVAALGDSDPPDYPSSQFDLIWTDPYPYNAVTSVTSEQCPGLDE